MGIAGGVSARLLADPRHGIHEVKDCQRIPSEKYPRHRALKETIDFDPVGKQRLKRADFGYETHGEHQSIDGKKFLSA